jgi:Periplasmic binding protein
MSNRKQGLSRRALIGGATTGAAWCALPSVVRPAAAAGEFKIGLFIALSGPASLFGPSQKASAELATEEINKAGGILGRQIKLIPTDAGGPPAESTKSAIRLMLEEKVDSRAWRRDDRPACAGAAFHGSRLRAARFLCAHRRRTRQCCRVAVRRDRHWRRRQRDLGCDQCRQRREANRRRLVRSRRHSRALEDVMTEMIKRRLAARQQMLDAAVTLGGVIH